MFDEVDETRTIENDDVERRIHESGQGGNVKVKTLADNIKFVNML